MTSVKAMFKRAARKCLKMSPWVLVWITVITTATSLLPQRLDRVRFDYDIGHADSAAYAWQARNLAQGKGWKVPYVTNFLYGYDPRIERHDDQWPPLLSFVLTPVFAHLGPEANWANLTMIWIGTLFLPFSFCLLVQAVTHRAWPGLLAVLPLWFSMELFALSTKILSDHLVTAVLCLFLAALIGSQKIKPLLWFCGPLIALAWYGKGSQIILFPFFLVAVFLVHGPRMCLRKECLGTLLLGVLLMSPRLWENSRDHGDPFHSSQSVVSSYFGMSREGWDPGFYSIYLGRDLPGMRNRFDHPSLHARSIARNAEQFFRHLLLGLDAGRSDWEQLGEGVDVLARELRAGKKAPRDILKNRNLNDLTIPAGLYPVLAGLAAGILGLFSAPGDWLFHLFGKRSFPLQSQRVGAAVLFAFVVVQALFIVLLWKSMLRLLLPSLIVAMALVWTLLPPWPQKWKFPEWAGCLLTFLFCISFFLCFQKALPELRQSQLDAFKKPAPAKPHYPWAKGVGESLAGVLPSDAVFMARNPWEILWYAPEGLKGVGMPYARPEEIFAMAKYYDVTYFIQDKKRPGVQDFMRKYPEVFTEVLRRPRSVYQIHWDQLDQNLLTPLEKIEPLWDPQTELQREEVRLKKRWTPPSRDKN